MILWYIEHISETDENGVPLAWSNENGFTSGDDFYPFTEEEKKIFSLPIDGKWQKIEE